MAITVACSLSCSRMSTSSRAPADYADRAAPQEHSARTDQPQVPAQATAIDAGTSSPSSSKPARESATDRAPGKPSRKACPDKASGTRGATRCLDEDKPVDANEF